MYYLCSIDGLLMFYWCSIDVILYISYLSCCGAPQTDLPLEEVQHSVLPCAPSSIKICQDSLLVLRCVELLLFHRPPHLTLAQSKHESCQRLLIQSPHKADLEPYRACARLLSEKGDANLGHWLLLFQSLPPFINPDPNFVFELWWHPRFIMIYHDSSHFSTKI